MGQDNKVFLLTIDEGSVDLVLRDGPWGKLTSTKMKKNKNVSTQAGGAPDYVDDDDKSEDGGANDDEEDEDGAGVDEDNKADGDEADEGDEADDGDQEQPKKKKRRCILVYVHNQIH